jgi:hypothetical protein
MTQITDAVEDTSAADLAQSPTEWIWLDIIQNHSGHSNGIGFNKLSR